MTLLLVCRDALSHRADICTTALFTETWICPCCGRELCAPCVISINEVSPENMFRRITNVMHFVSVKHEWFGLSVLWLWQTRVS
jgi:hypothetical protein